jgi:head-tail adaptor
VTIGRRDTLVTFELRSDGADDPLYGPQPGAWSLYSQAWAEVQDLLPSRGENAAEGINLSRQPARVRIDYYDGIGITAAMRIAIAGDTVRPARTLRIISGPAFVQKTSEWEFVAESLSTSGEEP